MGYLWEPSTDIIGIKFEFNRSKKCKGVNLKPNLTISDLDNFRDSVISKRQVLSLCNRIYDPLEMAAPYIIKLKLLIRESLLQQDRSGSNKNKFVF